VSELQRAAEWHSFHWYVTDGVTAPRRDADSDRRGAV